MLYIACYVYCAQLVNVVENGKSCNTYLLDSFPADGAAAYPLCKKNAQNCSNGVIVGGNLCVWSWPSRARSLQSDGIGE
jgi:hypothetical protein